MFTKLGRDEVLMAPHMHLGVSAISTQGRIKGRGTFLKKTSFSDRKATATNRMYSNDLEACGRSVVIFGSIPKFLSRSLYSGERQWPFGPLVYDILD